MSLYRRLSLLLLLLIMGAIGSTLVVAWSQTQTKVQVYQEHARADAEAAAQIIALYDDSLSTYTTDYSQWDDMFHFAQTCDAAWANANLGAARTTFHADAVWVFQRDGQLCYATDPTLDLNPASLGLGALAPTVGAERHAFHRMGATIWDIAAATIHPSSDYTRSTAPQGWFIVGRRFDATVLAELSTLLRSRVSLETVAAPAPNADQASDMQRIDYPLYDFQGAPLTVLTMMSHRPLVRELDRMTTGTLVVIIIMNLLTFGLLSLGTARWVVAPLHILTRSLQAARPTALDQLAQERGEFGQLAGLVQTFFAQHQKLTQEVEARRQAEATLQSFFDSAGVMMGIVELSADDVRHIADNQVSAVFFGTTVEAMQGQWAGALGVLPATIQIWHDAYQTSTRLGQPVQFDYVHPTPNGPCWMAATVGEIAAATHGPPRYSYVATDITARKVAEQQLALVNTQLHALADTDGLTGLSNRTAFDARLAKEVAWAGRHATPLTLLLIDLDYFKSYNDTYGHVAGDEALRAVAQIFRMQARQSDLPARYGGEEFAVVLPNTKVDEAVLVAERIRQGVAQTPGLRRALTISIGVAIFVPPMTVAQFIELADRALYRAKAQGRNLVVTTYQLAQELR